MTKQKMKDHINVLKHVEVMFTNFRNLVLIACGESTVKRIEAQH